LLCAIFLMIAMLTAWLGSRRMASAPPSLAMDDWDVPKLVAYLRKAGVEVYTVPCQRNDVVDGCAFLSVTQKAWRDVYALTKGPNHIHEWRGIVYCARESSDDAASLATQWGDRCLRIGPFICYGDADLLARIGATFRDSTPAESS
jgi:hypothetical protein